MRLQEVLNHRPLENENWPLRGSGHDHARLQRSASNGDSARVFSKLLLSLGNCPGVDEPYPPICISESHFGRILASAPPYRIRCQCLRGHPQRSALRRPHSGILAPRRVVVSTARLLRSLPGDCMPRWAGRLSLEGKPESFLTPFSRRLILELGGSDISCTTSYPCRSWFRAWGWASDTFARLISTSPAGELRLA